MRDGISNTYLNIVENADPQEQGIPKLAVMNKAAQSERKKQHIHMDSIQEIILMKKIYEGEDENPLHEYPGYIHFIAINSFRVIMFKKKKH